jgi:hypothetical protein
MIHNPSLVACNPFGFGPGDLKTVSTFPTLRAGILPVSMPRRALAGSAAASAKNSLRLIMGFPFSSNRCDHRLITRSRNDLPLHGD